MTNPHYRLNSLLPVVNARVSRGDFVSQTELANAYGINKGTATYWRRRAVDSGLTTEKDWSVGFIRGRLNQLGIA